MTPATSLIMENIRRPSLNHPAPLSPDPAAFDFSTLSVIKDRGSGAKEASPRSGEPRPGRTLIIYRPTPELRPLSGPARNLLRRLRHSASRAVPALLFGTAAVALFQSPAVIHGIEAAMGAATALANVVQL